MKIDKTKWVKVSLGDVVAHSTESIDPNNGVVTRYVAGEHMETDRFRISSWGDIGDGYLGPAFIRRFHVGQVLYGSRRTYLRKLCVADFEGVCANTTFVLNTKDPQLLLQSYLPYVMTTEEFHSYSVRESKGSVNPYVNWSDIAKYKFSLPPISEQQSLCTLFRQLEDLLDKLEHTRLNAYAAVEILRDQIYKKSDYLPIREIATIERGVSWSSSQQVSPKDGIPVLGIPNVKHGSLLVADITHITGVRESVIDSARVGLNSILMVGSNGNPERVGNVAMCGNAVKDYLPASFLLHIRGKSILKTRFLFEMLMSRSIQNQITNVVEGSTGLKNLAITWVRELPIPSLSDSDIEIFMEQIAIFKEAVDSLDEEILKIRGLSFKLRNILAGNQL